MANDRMLLLCRCGQAVSIYKYYPGGGYETTERRQSWIDEHIKKCHPSPFSHDLSGYVPFTLITENALDAGKWHDGVLYITTSHSADPQTP